MSFSNWSTTAASNTSATTGVNYDENQPPSTVNDAGRELMAQLKDAVVDKTSSQTLTNKTLTSPVINSATGIGQALIKRKTADESVTSSTTLQDDDHLTFSIAANEEWVVHYLLSIPNACLLSTTGMKLAVTVPASATGLVTARFVGDGTDNSLTVKGSLGSAMTFAAGTIVSAGGMFDVMVNVINSSNAGSVTLQFAQNTSNGTAVTISKGSFLVAHRVA